MAPPKTILQLTGAAPTPHALATSVVVMIDAQMEYITGQMPLTGIEAALEEGARLLGAARDQGRPIIHIQQNGKPGGLFDPDGPTFPIAEAVAPQGDEPVVAKTLPNAFAKTELEDLLGGFAVESVIFAGFMTHMCVSSTVRAALDRGIACTVLAGACATRDLPDGGSGVVAAAELHRAELAALSDRFCAIAQSVDNLAG